MRISMKNVASLFICVLYVKTPLHVWAEQCDTVNTFADLVRIVNLGMARKFGEICFQPFLLVKPIEMSLVLNRPISLRCDKRLASDKCTISGEGNHITIEGSNAKVEIVGFKFTGATRSAVSVKQTSVQSHTIVGSEFIMNRASMIWWRGGAIKTEVGTTLTISQCSFVDNHAAGGGAIFHRGKSLDVSKSKFTNNVAKAGAALAIEFSPNTDLSDCVFTGNRATGSNTGAIEQFRSELILRDSLSGSANFPCEGIFDRSRKLCRKWQSEVNTAFDLGQLTVNLHGLSLSTGLTAKIIARSGELVSFTSLQRKGVKSSLKFHENPDAAAVFPLKDGGWIYMSNAENEDGKGGVYGLEFDSKGEVRDYVSRLTGTTRNCSGGKTPWNSWVSCEEYKGGHCWQVDPTGNRDPTITKLVEGKGHFEAMTYDIRNLNHPRFFVTEDHERGAVRRFTPACNALGLSWNTIQVKGNIDYLEFTGVDTFRWTSSLEDGRSSAQKYYRNVEGISFDNGFLYFVAKEQKEIFRLNVDTGIYSVDSTQRGLLSGGGNFEAQPDQLIHADEMVYFTEDGGSSPGIFASDGVEYFTVFVANDKKFVDDETTGIAFSPDGTKMYACIQEIGYLYEISRHDGLPFPGHKVSTLKFSNTNKGT